MVGQLVLEPVQLRGVTTALPVVWQRKKIMTSDFMPTKKVTSIANSWRKTTPITRNEDNCPQTAWRQVFRHLLRSQSARRRDNEDNIRHNNQMGQSADGIRLQVKVCARRADSTCGAVSRTGFDYKTSEIDKICFFFSEGNLLLRHADSQAERHQKLPPIGSNISICFQMDTKRCQETILRSSTTSTLQEGS